MNKYVHAKWFPVFAGIGLIANSVGAAGPVPTVIYDNAVTPLNTYFASQSEFGDQITTPGGGWIADTFTFEYFASGLSGNETGKVRFYANDGDLLSSGNTSTPKTLLYESGSFKLVNGNIPVTVTDLVGLNVLLPKSFTWTIEPTGVTGAEVFGLKLYNPPLVGSSFNDFWQKQGTDWVLKQVSGNVANFGAQLIAVPEPSAVTLLALGGVALLLRRRAVR